MGICIALDQLSKFIVENFIPVHESVSPIPFLSKYIQFVHKENHGAVFGTMQGNGRILSVMAVLIVTAVLYTNYRYGEEKPPVVRVMLAMIAGGAIGNLIDRIRLGHVTDFIDIDLSSIIPLSVADWYVFNVADFFVVTGLCIYSYLFVFKQSVLDFSHKEMSHTNE